MNVIGATDQFEPLFPDDFLPDIVGRIFVARDCIPKPVKETLETRITKLLRHKYAYDPVIRKLPVQVRRELPIDDPATGEELGRIDLCLLHGNDEDVYFAFECKRLNVTFPNGRFESLAGDYVSEDGIGCFVSQKYSVGHSCGGMIGYVFDGDIPNACVRIARALSARASEIALQPDGLTNSSLIAEPPEVYETRHNVGNAEFVIYHLLLSVA